MARKRKIVILEDDQLFLDHLEILLRDSPHEVIKCETIQECLELIDKVDLDCGILDFNLPDGDSVKVLEALKKKDTAALVVTGRNEQAVIKRVFQSGCQDYIQKMDVTPDNLMNAIQKTIMHSDLLKELTATRVELENFVRTAAHDLKTPLSTLNGHLFLLQMAIEENNKEDIAESIREVGQAGEDMARLIDALLEYTKVGWVFKPVKVNLNSVMEVVLKRIDSLVRENNANIKLSPEPLPVIMGDKDLLTQLLQNLISNAIKYRSLEDPVIQVEVVVDSENPAKARISIKDNGMGIPQNLHQKIFEPLERGTATTQEGHGIGLATCQRIVEKHGGDIWVESEPGKGSIFIFAIGQDG